MVLLSSTNELSLGSKAPFFNLIGTDDKTHSISEFLNNRALLVIFMCNHCPYTKAVQRRINALARDFSPRGLAVVGINSNDPTEYPEDSFENMKKRAHEQNYVFPYLYDETQSVARAYMAVCTPDPFLFENVNGEFILRYHGRIDDNWRSPSEVKRHELAESIEAVLSGKPASSEQQPAMGCSIKWKTQKAA